MRWWREEFDRHVCSRALGATRYRSPRAVNMLAAIALQEAAGNVLFQRMSDGTPARHLARSLWQLERPTVAGLAGHEAARRVLDELDPGLATLAAASPRQVWERCAWDLVLACRLARALLWTVPEPLPPDTPAGEEEAWRQYLWAWRPGKPDRARWHRVWRGLTGGGET